MFGIAACAAFFAFTYVYISSTAPRPETAEVAATPEGHNAYLKAISEPNAALRRARLQDYLAAHPSDPRHFAAMAQLDVLNAYETRDWNYITKIAYEDGLTHAERISTLEDYNQRWGGDLLGGRTKDIQALRARILDLPDRIPKPDRRLNEGTSPIPRNITSDRLLGEPRRRRALPPPPPPVARKPEIVKPPADIITPLVVRRNSTARYPSKALRNNVEGLVVLRLSVDAKGRVRLTELVEVQAARYQKDFIKSAQRAARKMRFHPQTVNGRAVPVSGVMKRYRFKPDG